MQHGERRLWHKDGTFIDLEIDLKVISYSQNSLVCALVHDIAERKHSEEQIHLQLKRLESLRTVGISIITHRDLQGALDTLVEQVVTQLKVDASCALLINPRNARLEWAASRGFWSDAFIRTSLKMGEVYAGLSEAERRVLHASNLDNPNANIRLARAYESTVEGWSRALELRDLKTEGHSQRVSSMAIQLGQRLGLFTEDLDVLHLGAFLHDIGKRGIPDAILLKPRPLSPNERAIMSRHPTYAYELLGPIEYLHLAIDIPFCHHERWDGSGYPRQLREKKFRYWRASLR